MRHTRTGTFIAMATLALLSATWLASGQSGGDEGPSDRMLRYDGVTRPGRAVELTVPIDGRIQEITVDEGDLVQAGEVLLRMDDALQKLAVAAAKLQAEATADIERAAYARDEAKIMYERAREAFENEAASEWEMRRAKLAWDQAIATVEAAREAKALAEAQLALEQERLTRYTLQAPWDGQLVRVLSDEGATMTTRDPVLRLASLDPLEAEFDLPYAWFERMREGERYRLLYRLDDQQGEWKSLVGRLKPVSKVFDRASRTFRVVFAIDNSTFALPAGVEIYLANLTPLDR